MAALLAAVILWLAIGGDACAQGPLDAGLRGSVVTPEGRGIGGIEILVQSVEGGQQKLISARDGSFLVLRLVPGEYVVSAQGDSERVQLHAGELSELQLRVKGTSQNAAAFNTNAPVASGSAPLPASDAEVLRRDRETYTVSERGELPQSSWESVAAVDSTTNVSANDAALGGENGADDTNAGEPTERNLQASDGDAATGRSSAGLAVSGDATTIDGLSARQNFGAGPRGATPGGVHVGAMFGEEAVREFRVLPRTFSAQLGGAGGGIAVVSRGAVRGPSEWHGAAFVQARQSAWAATNPFSVATHYRDGVVTNSLVKPQDARQQFGAQIGWSLPQRLLPAPLKRGVQVFASVEEQLSENTIVSTPQLASFYQLTNGQTILLGNRGVSASQTNAALNYLDSLSGEVSELATRTLLFARADVQPWARDHITLAYIRNRFSAPAGLALGQASSAVVAHGRGSIGASSVQIDAGTARWLHEFSPRFNHELRGQIARDLEFETPRAPLPQEPAIGPGGFVPQVSIGPSGFAYGTPATLGRTAYPDERRIELADLMQIAWRGQLFSVGGDWSRIDDRIASFNNAEGSFQYDRTTTTGQENGLVDWITDYTLNVNAYPNGGCPSVNASPHYFCFHTFTQSFGPLQTEFITHEFAGFAEDAMRVGQDLTVTLGARYEYMLLPLPQAPNYTLDAALKSVLGARAGLTENFPEDRNNAGPRAAIAWSPHFQKGGRKGTPLVTVHAGYGMFFGRLAGQTVRSALIDTALPSTALNIRIRPTFETVCPQTTSQVPAPGFGYPCTYITTPPAAVQQTTQAIVFAKNFRLPQVQRATFEIERTVGRHAWLRGFYSMALAQQLPQSVDVNIAPSPAQLRFVVQGGGGHAGIVNGQTFRLPLYTSRLLTQYGAVTEIESNANATYHAGTVEARWRGASVEARAGYTFSRAIDYAPQASAIPRTNGQLDPFANGYDKGISGLNFPQRFSGEMIYSPRFARGPKGLRASLNGLRVAAIAQAGSGAPYSYGVYGGSYLSGGSDSVNGSGGATYLPTVGRNTLRLPARSNVDARLSRAFRMGDRVRGEGFLEAFNLLNTVQLSRVETRAFLVGTPTVANNVVGPTPLIFQDAATIATEGLSTPAFGTPLSSTSGGNRERQVELGLRLQF